jgi:hypothetical protein
MFGFYSFAAAPFESLSLAQGTNYFVSLTDSTTITDVQTAVAQYLNAISETSTITETQAVNLG